VKVIGASSMGALRAAELDNLGMEGAGEIYRAYREGKLVADDEVALIFEPEAYLPLSEPLVNIRATLQRAVERAAIDDSVARVILDVARGVYFPDRTYENIADAAEPMLDPGIIARFRAYAGENSVDIKKEDAVAALKRIRTIAEEMDSGVR
jgi:TfuA protein